MRRKLQVLPAKLVIPAGVTAIGGEAFKRCRIITSVVIPEGVTSIGGAAFAECKSLKSVTFVGENAFDYCDKLKEVKYAGTKAQWEAIEKTSSGIGRFVVRCTDGDVFVE